MSNTEPLTTTETTLPFTGAEYLESLRDGREIWIHGKRVDDVTTHAAFRNTARMVARLYDAMHDPENRGTLAVPTDTGNGGFTHPFFKVARSQDDLRQGAKAIEAWARMTYGWLGRSPDYKAGFMTSLGASPEMCGDYSENGLAWYRKVQERMYFINHAIINPPVDRDSEMGAADDVLVRVVEENDEGIVVSGAKVVATNAALTHYNFIGNFNPVGAKELSPVFLCPVNAPGVKLICRPSYELNAAVMGSPFDYPLSSRFDENDSILVLDRVFIPWSDVLVYDVEKSNNLFPSSGFAGRSGLHGCTRLAVKFDFLVGLFIKAVEMTGTVGFRGVQTRIGELIGLRNLFWTCIDSMVENPVIWPDGTCAPNPDAAGVYRLMMIQAYPRALEIFQQDVASALVYLPSSVAEWENPEVRPFIDKFVRGSGDRPAEERVKLMKLIWDAVGSEFGGRHELYERNYSGNHEFIKMLPFFEQSRTGQVDGYKSMVDEFMSEYDLNGWTVDDLISNDDVSYFSANRH